MDIILQIIAILVLAKLLGEVMEWMGQSSMVGEILAGIVLGPSLLGWVEYGEVLEILSELGIVALLFISGAEMDLGRLSESRASSATTAAAGIATPLLAGVGVGLLFGLDLDVSLVLGVALSATSIGISVRSLIDVRKLNSRVGTVIVGAAVVDDMVGIVLLAIISTLVLGKGELADALLPMAIGVIVLVMMVTVGRETILKAYARVRRAHTHEMPYSTAIIMGLAVGAMADLAGLHYALGAFMAGLVIGPHVRKDVKLMESLSDFAFGFMVTFFFVSVGVLLTLSLERLVDAIIPVIVLAAIASKVIGGYLGSRSALGRGLPPMLVGVGMCPRGEITLVVANIALVGGLIDDTIYAALTLTVIVTVLFTPSAIRRGFEALDAQRS